MKKKALKKLLSLVIVLTVAVALCACGGDKSTDEAAGAEGAEESAGEAGQADAADNNSSQAGEPTTGGSVTVGMTQDLVSLDPHVISDAGTRSVVFNLYEGLVKPTTDGELVPAVASDYEISSDAKVYTFTLRDGITFHDGSEVTVEDVKYSIERYAEIYGESSALSIILEEVVADSENNTVELHLTEGNSELLPELTLAIIPASNEDPAGNPIGTGPFQYVSYTPGQNLVISRYDGYWNAERKAYLDEVTFKFVADVETAYMELQAGTLDILDYLTTDQVATLADGYYVAEGSMNMVQALFLNSGSGPLADARVRQALNYAVDTQSINDFLFGGKSKKIGTHMLTSMTQYYNADTENVYSYDPQRAMELLAEAGYADGFDLTITVPSSYSQHVSTAEIIVENLRAVNINAQIELVEWNTWLTEVYMGGEFESTVIAFDGTLAPSDWLERFCSDSAENFMHYSNEEFDALYEKAYSAVDQEEKSQYYKEAEMILAEDAANVYIQEPADFVGIRDELAGYSFYPAAAYDMSVIYYKSAE